MKSVLATLAAAASVLVAPGEAGLAETHAYFQSNDFLSLSADEQDGLLQWTAFYDEHFVPDDASDDVLIAEKGPFLSGLMQKASKSVLTRKKKIEKLLKKQPSTTGGSRAADASKAAEAKAEANAKMLEAQKAEAARVQKKDGELKAEVAKMSQELKSEEEKAAEKGAEAVAAEKAKQKMLTESMDKQAEEAKEATEEEKKVDTALAAKVGAEAKAEEAKADALKLKTEGETVKELEAAELEKKGEKLSLGDRMKAFASKAAESIGAMGESVKKLVKSHSKLPIYGNSCGPGHGPSGDDAARAKYKAIDATDECCKSHDNCYNKQGYFNCGCDSALIGCTKRAKAKCSNPGCARMAGTVGTFFDKVMPCRKGKGKGKEEDKDDVEEILLNF